MSNSGGASGAAGSTVSRGLGRGSSGRSRTGRINFCTRGTTTAYRGGTYRNRDRRLSNTG